MNGPERTTPDPTRISSVADLAHELTLVRERAGLTVRQVDKCTGIATSTLGGYFGGRHRPSLESLERVLAACGVVELDAWRDALLRVRRPARKRPSDVAPYRGLESFGAEDAAWFFGRSRLTAEVVARIVDGPGGPLVVVGPSGAGKSSLLRAGVVPALGPDRVVSVVTPGRRAGAEQVPAADVVVVDQFEEVFAPEVPDEERTAFVDALLAASGRIVIVLRADFYARALAHPGLAAAVAENQLIVGPMTDDELREAVTAPAALAGVDIEAGLVELLLADVDRRGATGALPLLSHALLATWRHGDGARMTVADYRATGGIAGAVARSAEEAVAELVPEDVRRLFLRLVHVTPEAGDTRLRITRSELPDGLAAVLDRFVACRLLVVDADSVEIAHEVLLTAWPRLRDWIDADRIGLVEDRRLAEAARAWRDGGEDPDLLLRGARLATASERAPDADHTVLERSFLHAGEEEDRLRRATRRRQARRLRGLVAALTALLLVAVGLGAYSVRQGIAIGAERDVAVSRQVAVRSDALRAEDPSLAAQLAVAAYRIAPTPESRSSLLNSTGVPVPTRMPGPAGVAQSLAVRGDRLVSVSGASPAVQVWSLAQRGSPVRLVDTAEATGALAVVALSPDGATAAAGGADGTVVLFALDDPAPPVPLAGSGGSVLALAFTAGGVVAGTADGVVRRWEDGGAEQPPLAGPTDAVHSVAVSPDGRLLAAGSADNSVHLWDLADPAPAPVVLTGSTGKVYSVAFAPDGRTLVAGSADRSVHRWDLTDPRAPVPATPLTGPTNWVNAVAFSPDGTTIAGGSSDGTARLWDAATGRPTATLPHPGPVTAAAFVDDDTLATGEADGVAHLWPVRGPVLPPFDDAVFALDFDDSGARLAVGPGSKDGTAALWDVASGGGPRPVGVPVRNPDGEPGFSGSAALTPDGATLAVGRKDGSVRLWDVTDADRPLVRPPLVGSTDLVEQLAISPDGRRLAVSGDDNTVRLWDLAAPSVPTALTGAGGYVLASAFSPDSGLLAAASADTNTYLWDVRGPKPRLLASLDGPSSYAYSPAFSPDGRTLAVGSADKTVRLWDVTDPARPVPLGVPLTGPANYVYSVAFSPDGASLAAASTDGTVWLWDVTRPAAPLASAVLTGPSEAVFAVAWSPDGRRLAIGSADRTVRVFAAVPEQAATAVCASAGAALSAAEWVRFVPDLPYDPPC